MPKTERFNTVVVGAGQYGLSTGYYLKESGDDFVIVDAGSRLGDSWRKRWDSLRLFTEAKFNDLPGTQFPCDPKARSTYFATKDETADYIESFASKFGLPVRLGVKIHRLSKNGGSGYLLDTGAGQIEANNVVVATGPFQDAKIPAFAKELAPSIVQIHSSQYKNPDQLPNKDTLVVGAATSGCQIAMDLAATRKVYLAGRNVGSTPPWLDRMMSPIFPWFSSRTEKSFVGRSIKKQVRTEGHPLIGFTYKHVKKAGVERVMSRVAGVRDGKPLLDGDRVLDVGCVVWCTGYSLNFSWIDLPIFGEDGYPRHVRGVVEDAPGLFFVGLVFLNSLYSQLIYGTQKDSKHIAEQAIARSRPATAAAPSIPEPGLQAG